MLTRRKDLKMEPEVQKELLKVRLEIRQSSKSTEIV